MAELNEIYRRAGYYDIAFGRPVGHEAAFLVDLHRALRGRAPGSVLELACGPGYHARALARMGLRVTGLDLRPEMVAYAADRAKAEGVAVDWIAGDMRYPPKIAPVDVALCAFDSLDYLLENDDIVAHFRAMAAALAPGGIYVAEMTHPRDCSPYHYGHHRYEGTRDGVSVSIEWVEARPDLVRQVTRVRTEMTIRQDGRTETIGDRAAERFCSVQEYALLAGQSGALRLERVLGDWRLDRPLDDSPASRRLLLVFERTT